MEFSAVNDISEFWFEFFPPFFLGVTSLICFLWVVGKENRLRLMRFFTEDKSTQYVQENGIYVPQNVTLRNVFIGRIVKLLGVDSGKPLVSFFIIYVFFYGLNQIILLCFQPLLIVRYSTVLYAAGVEEETIAAIWMFNPSAQIHELYSVVLELTDPSPGRVLGFFVSLKAFVRFDLLCCLVLFILMIFRRINIRADKKVHFRLFLLAGVLFFLVIGMLFSDIHQENEEVKQLCYRAHSMLLEENESNPDLYDDEQYQHYIDLIREDKQRVSNKLFYGAYGINNRYAEAWDFVVSIVGELYRFFSQHISDLFSFIAENTADTISAGVFSLLVYYILD